MFSSERLKGIDVFVCVADAGSFRVAAERMHLTASAISKSIARLEARLGSRLFQRTTRRLALTDAGMTFYRTCSGVLANLEEAELALHSETTELQGRVRLDLPGAFGRAQALPLILQFAQEHPRLLPHISFSDRYSDPIAEGVDIVVRIGGADIWPDTLGHHYLGNEWQKSSAQRRGGHLTAVHLDALEAEERYRVIRFNRSHISVHRLNKLRRALLSAGWRPPPVANRSRRALGSGTGSGL